MIGQVTPTAVETWRANEMARRRWLSEYRDWLRTSGEAPAAEYRRWAEIERQAKHKRALARAAALRAYRRAHPQEPIRRPPAVPSFPLEPKETTSGGNP